MLAAVAVVALWTFLFQLGGVLPLIDAVRDTSTRSWVYQVAGQGTVDATLTTHVFRLGPEATVTVAAVGGTVTLRDGGTSQVIECNRSTCKLVVEIVLQLNDPEGLELEFKIVDPSEPELLRAVERPILEVG